MEIGMGLILPRRALPPPPARPPAGNSFKGSVYLDNLIGTVCIFDPI